MSAATTIKIACPACRARYRMPSSAAGRKARCKKCKTAFRIREGRAERKQRLPTEDDIIRWLNDGTDENEVPIRPRVEGAPETAPSKPKTHPAEVVPAPVAAETETAPEPGRIETVSLPDKEETTRPTERLTTSETDYRERILPFRKTG